KSSASETLAPPAVACDIFSFRRSAHPPGGFLLYGSEVSYRVKKQKQVYSNVIKIRIIISE
ncbi:MAG: hypothetical protein SOV77_08700, partial [Lachnospiraceae bacterium]|nr:hypothetical protein [Lachnospiraceae bacterium]